MEGTGNISNVAGDVLEHWSSLVSRKRTQAQIKREESAGALRRCSPFGKRGGRKRGQGEGREGEVRGNIPKQTGKKLPCLEHWSSLVSKVV